MPFVQPGFDLVQARFTRNDGPSHLQGDVVVNTFYFQSDGSPEARTTIRDLLDNFYTKSDEAGPYQIRNYMSGVLDSLTYYMRAADAPQGFPGDEIPSATWVKPSTGTNLPPELAVCASYRAEPPYTARRRGRIYIGTLKQTAMTDGVVSATFIDAINYAAADLALNAEAAELDWVIASRVGNTAAKVYEGYTNNSFDVQRSRDPHYEERSGRTPAQWFTLDPN